MLAPTAIARSDSTGAGSFNPIPTARSVCSRTIGGTRTTASSSAQPNSVGLIAAAGKRKVVM